MQDFHWFLFALIAAALWRRWHAPPHDADDALPAPRWRTLAQAMAQRGDNLLLLRLLAASAVIYGHSYAVCGIPGAADHIARQGWGYGLYSGSIAVQVFFAVSGFLVTGAWLRRPDLGFFLRSRALRIVPAYLACLAISALVLGAFVTELPRAQYFADPQTWRYIWQNLTFSTEMVWQLPGVFSTNPYPNTVNGSLWTLVVEARVYVWLALCGLLGLLQRRERWFCAAALLIAAVCTGYPLPMMPIGDFLPLAGFFLAGSAFYRWREIVPFHGALIPALAALAVLAHGGDMFLPLYGLALCYAVLWFAYGPRRLLGFNRLGDYSYGVYLWGFPIQQLVAGSLDQPTPTRITVIALPCALAAGALSWHLLEKPLLRFKQPRRTAASGAPAQAGAAAAAPAAG
jgi:peptidoglycan/LPS O-acetylase OafA/YrhL